MKPQHSANLTQMRRINRALILRHLRSRAPVSRAELAHTTGLTRSTVSSLVDELIAAQLIHETGIGPSRGGRPGTLLELNPAGGGAIGVEITSDALTVLLTDFVARPLWQQDYSLHALDDSALLPTITATIQAALAQAEAHRLRVFGIGVGIAGLVDPQAGRLQKSAHLPFDGYPFRDDLQERFGLPVQVGNEASIAALGEHYFGAAQGIDDFIYLGIGSKAIGAGIVLGGELYQGLTGYAGEAGHMVIDRDGPACQCGRSGCWEVVLRDAIDMRGIRAQVGAGAPTVLAELARAGTAITFRRLAAAAAEGDTWARATLERVLPRILDVLAVGIANLVNLFNPPLIVLGGTVGGALVGSEAQLRAEVARLVILPEPSVPQIVTSPITSNACALGAVAVVLDGVLSDPVH